MQQRTIHRIHWPTRLITALVTLPLAAGSFVYALIALTVPQSLDVEIPTGPRTVSVQSWGQWCDSHPTSNHCPGDAR